MPVREILIIPDKRLRLVSGIGLAAIQVGEPRRIVTMDLAKKDEPKEPQVFINPEIVSHSGEKNTHEEGCLSIPE